METCPYRSRHCVAYLTEARDLSDGLAERIESRYCSGNFRECSRYRAARAGLLAHQPGLAPWTAMLAPRPKRFAAGA